MPPMPLLSSWVDQHNLGTAEHSNVKSRRRTLRLSLVLCCVVTCGRPVRLARRHAGPAAVARGRAAREAGGGEGPARPPVRAAARLGRRAVRRRAAGRGAQSPCSGQCLLLLEDPCWTIASTYFTAQASLPAQFCPQMGIWRVPVSRVWCCMQPWSCWRPASSRHCMGMWHVG